MSIEKSYAEKLNGEVALVLTEIGNDDQLLEVARKAIEDTLIELRDERISQPLRNNGLVVKERDGTPSDLIRFGPETAVRIGLRAIAKHIKETK